MLAPLFFLISRLNLVFVSGKVYKIIPIKVAYMKPKNLKFCVPLRFIYRNGRDFLIKKTVYDFSLLYPRKNGLKRKSNVCPFDTQIK